jgi:hypothetical protein
MVTPPQVSVAPYPWKIRVPKWSIHRRNTDMILELADEEQNRDENQEKSSFSDTQQQEKAARCNPLFFWG